jgi:hypothetical protein
MFRTSFFQFFFFLKILCGSTLGWAHVAKDLLKCEVGSCGKIEVERFFFRDRRFTFSDLKWGLLFTITQNNNE